MGCLFNLYKSKEGQYIVLVLQSNVTVRSICLSVVARYYAISALFFEHVRLFWRTVFVIVLNCCNNNKHLYKASIFVCSHVDKSIQNLKNIPFKVHLEQIKDL